MLNVHDIIEQAMGQGQNVTIEYRDSNGELTNRVVTPIRWVTSGRFTAFCYLRQAERDFRIDRILQIQIEEDHSDDAFPDSSCPSPKESEASSGDVSSVSSPQLPEAVAVDFVPTRASARRQTVASPKPPISRVETGEQWSRLVNYYRECLIRETRQQYLIKNEPGALRFLSIADQEVYEFLEGRSQVQLSAARSNHPDPLVQFVNAGKDRPRQQLCLGYPVLVVEGDRLAPLIVSSVTSDSSVESLFLRADEPSPSYAALSAFKMTEEDIAVLLAECDKVQPRQGQTLTEAWEELLVDRFTECVGHPLRRSRWDDQNPLTKHTLLTTPCLFWVSSSVTSNLIAELGELARPQKWGASSVSLKRLFDKAPEHEYPAALPLAVDEGIYITEVNEDQRQAVVAARSEELTIVTGPPGTGKSQLVLNLIAQAVVNGQSVLFASRNNDAVDVVMNRLKGELKFSGAIRTGNRQYRQSAARDMVSALDLIATVGPLPPTAAQREAYRVAGEQLQDTTERLMQVRELVGLLESYNTERQDLAVLLPGPTLEIADSCDLSFSREDAEHLGITLSTLLTSSLKIKSEAAQLKDELLHVVSEEAGQQNTLLAALYAFEKQWGTFGGRFLHPAPRLTLDDLKIYAQTWLALLPALDVRSCMTALAQQQRKVYAYRWECQETVPGELRAQVKATMYRCGAQDLVSLCRQAQGLTKRSKTLVNTRLPLWKAILVQLGLAHPVKKILRDFVLLRETLGVDWAPWSVKKDPTLEEMLFACQGLVAFIKICLVQSRMNDLQNNLAGEQQKLDVAFQALPLALQEDVRRIELSDTESDALREQIGSLLVRIDDLIARRDQLSVSVNAKLDGNEDALAILESLKATLVSNDVELWKLPVSASLEAMISHLTRWQNLISFWKIEEDLRRLHRQLEALPTEDDLVALVRHWEHEKMAAGVATMNGRWLEHAKGLDTTTLQGAHDYASASQQLAENYDPANYSTLKALAEENLRAALQVFPIWATTNLSTKSNFALTPGMFDVVIIDEASQCDIPSALPLLYRAKRAVIIGDPNQLRHVATLYQKSDSKAAEQWGIAPGAFLYNTHSLFDLAARSVGVHPGALMLKEHYRSDPQIIRFSNEEFYDNRLVIRTDLSLRGMPQAFLNKGCGVFWLHRDGVAEHPSGGSAFNVEELKAVQELVPAVLEALQHYEKADGRQGYHFSVGIVTPYREQADRIRSWVLQALGGDDRIMVGTAHTFQGNERDIMIFSSVLAPGLSEGSRAWLDATANLLNVAITRARAQLIIVGHWDYCRSLPPSSKYHRLASYVGDQLGHQIQSVAELPLLGDRREEIIGTLTGDKTHSRITLRKFITSCREFVWWVDPFLQNHIFDLFLEIAQSPEVDFHEVRLLTSSEQAESSNSGKPELNPDKARLIARELASRGIRFDLRLLPKRDLPHDRFLYSVGESINMPPFGGAYGDHKHVSEYTHSATRPEFFEEYWERAKSI